MYFKFLFEIEIGMGGGGVIVLVFLLDVVIGGGGGCNSFFVGVVVIWIKFFKIREKGDYYFVII